MIRGMIYVLNLVMATDVSLQLGGREPNDFDNELAKHELEKEWVLTQFDPIVT